MTTNVPAFCFIIKPTWSDFHPFIILSYLSLQEGVESLMRSKWWKLSQIKDMDKLERLQWEAVLITPGSEAVMSRKDGAHPTLLLCLCGSPDGGEALRWGPSIRPLNLAVPMMYSNNRKLQTGHGGKGGVTLSTHAWSQTYGQKTHLIVESGEVCVPSENNPALIWSLSDQDLKNL